MACPGREVGGSWYPALKPPAAGVRRGNGDGQMARDRRRPGERSGGGLLGDRVRPPADEVGADLGEIRDQIWIAERDQNRRQRTSRGADQGGETGGKADAATPRDRSVGGSEDAHRIPPQRSGG